MPSCHLPFRSLLRSRSYIPSGRTGTLQARWPIPTSSFSTTCERSQRDETASHSQLDLSKVSADSSYLDFLLGPSEEPPAPVYVEQKSKPNKKKARSEAKDEVKATSDQPVKKSASRKKLRKSPNTRHGQIRKETPPNPPLAQGRVKGSKGRAPRHRIHGVASVGRRKWTAPISLARVRARNLRRLAAWNKHHKDVFKPGTSLIPVRNGRQPLRWLWYREFGKLRKRYNPSFAYQPHFKNVKLSPKAPIWAKECLQNIEKEKSPDAASVSNSEDLTISETRQIPIFHWQNIALWLLEHEPENMIAFLRHTHVHPYPHRLWIQNALWYLSAHLSRADNPRRQEHVSSLIELFESLAQRDDRAGRFPQRIVMFSSFFRNMLAHCSEEQASDMYRTIKRHHVQVHWQSLMQFTTYFARRGHFEQALDALLDAKSRSADIDSFSFRSNCATLFRSSVRQAGGLRVSTRIIDNLVGIGLTLNVQLCNIVMLNAVDARDINTAMTIYQSLVEQGLQADKYTFAILLKGCKNAINDADLLNSIIRDAIAQVNVRQDPVLALEILHCLALHHTKHNSEKAFETVADAFAQLFDVQPLQRLGIRFPNLSQPSHPDEKKLKLTPQAFGVMLAVYLEHVTLHTPLTLPVYELYKRYKTLANDEVEPFASTLETDYIANSFLMSFIQSKKGLLYAAEVIKDMQNLTEAERTPRCKPTVITWSIFLHGFTKHGQLQLAEQVLKYMRTKGIEPNQVTWNTLACGYAAAQDVEGTVDVIRRLEADGKTWDDWVVSSLKKLRNQDRFQEELRRSRQYDFTADIKEKLGSRIEASDEVQVLQRRKGDHQAQDYGVDSPGDMAEAGNYIPMNANR